MTKTICIGGPIQQAFDKSGKSNDALKNLILAVISTLKNIGYNVFSSHVIENFGESMPTENSSDIHKTYGVRS